MEFTVSRSHLVRELTLARGVVETKTTIPVLGNVLIETDGDKIQLAATDLELGLRCSCPAVVTKPGAGTIPAKRLLDYVRLLPEQDVDIKFSVQSNHWASLSCGKSKARIAGMSRESFPDLPLAAPIVVTLPIGILAGAIAKVIFAISKEETRFTLSGALLQIKDGTLTLVATDGHRMALITLPYDGDAALRVIMPLKALVQLQAMAKDDPSATASFSEDENNLFFLVGTRMLLARKMSGSFPDFERVLPNGLSHVAVIERDALKGAIERVAQFSDERSKAIRVNLAMGSIIASSVTDLGDSEEAVDAAYTDNDTIEIGFNSTYLLDFLRVAETTSVRLFLKDGITAGELRLLDGDGYRYVVMPIRL